MQLPGPACSVRPPTVRRALDVLRYVVNAASTT